MKRVVPSLVLAFLCACTAGVIVENEAAPDGHAPAVTEGSAFTFEANAGSLRWTPMSRQHSGVRKVDLPGHLLLGWLLDEGSGGSQILWDAPLGRSCHTWP
jgi:hypothetical protein